jgi:putative transposase
MKAHQKEHTVKKMASVLKVSRSGYYKWLRQPTSKRAREDAQLSVLIHKLFKQHRRCYGSIRIADDLRDMGYYYGKNRIARLMRHHALRAQAARKYKVTTNSDHNEPLAPNLVQRHFHACSANHLWLSDITYIWTDERWLYLAVVMDVYNRKVVGWSLSKRLTSDCVMVAIRQAIARECPGPELIFHSDRGCQYASKAVRELLAFHNIRQSMSGKGNCYDNAMMESFFHTLKVERVYQEHYYTRPQARLSIFDYIEMYYNRQRKHSALGYVPPVLFGKLKNVA